MQPNVTKSEKKPGKTGGSKPQYARFKPVKDKDGEPIRGLCKRNGVFYGRLSVSVPGRRRKVVKRVALVDSETQMPVRTIHQAETALAELKSQRKKNELPVLERTPTFTEYVDRNYQPFVTAGSGQKRPQTLRREGYCLKKWKKHLGDVRLNHINETHLKQWVTERLKAGITKRTVNVDIATFSSVMGHAKEDKFIKAVPRIKPQKVDEEESKRELLTREDVDLICNAALTARSTNGRALARNGQQFADYVKFLAGSGCREQEAFSLRWKDVSFERNQLTIHVSKNRRSRTLELNPSLREHLVEMQSRRAPDTDWLFPSPLRGDKEKEEEKRAKTFRFTLEKVRKHLGGKFVTVTEDGEEGVGFHDFRHHFISYAVMSGIDLLTIKEWVGHRDTQLIARIYGHLAQPHRQAQASRMSFEIAKNVLALPDDTDTRVEGIA